MATNAVETRLQVSVDKRADLEAKANQLLSTDENLGESDKGLLKAYREEMAGLDQEITELLADKEANDEANKRARLVRKGMIDRADGVEEDGSIYRTMAEYARDIILTRDTNGPVAEIQAQFGDKTMFESAASRLELLKRTPANTLSSNVAGLQTPQYIDQIFQIINKNRNLVNSAVRTALQRGTLTYPKVSQRPIVSVQATQKTEAGNQGMVVDLVTATASTYLGGGDLSWQAINWTTPDALQLWFDLAAADYALKTEQDAAQVIIDSAFTHHIGTQVGATDSFAQIMTGIGAGYAEVFANSGRVADTIYLAPDRFGYFLGLTSNAFTQFQTVSGSNIGPLNMVISRGLDSGTIIVGDSAGLLVAETDGAPVELRVVEPAIGGVEVGIIGAFEAVVVDDGAFALITTAS